MATPPQKPAPVSLRRWIAFAALLAAVALWSWRAQRVLEPSVGYSTLYTWVEGGKIARATLRGRQLEGALRAPAKVDGRDVSTFRTDLPERDDDLLPALRRNGVDVTVARAERPFLVELLMSALPWLIVLVAWGWLSRRADGAFARGPMAALMKSKSRRFAAEGKPPVTFEDIAGLANAKRDLQEIVQFLKAPEPFRRLGAKVPRGVLLVGPPGTGKTLLARAVAGESGVPFFSVIASEFVEMFVGLGAARVRDLFAEAKKSAPAIIFIDEIDAVGRARGAGLGMGNDEREQTLNQLLAELDGFSREQALVVLAATNRPDVLDPALLRPGRFDRRVVVERPELAARRSILNVHAKGKPLGPDVDLQAIAESTPGFSGADLANLVNEAAINAIRRGGATIGADDFAAAADKVILGDPREGKLTGAERRRVAVHEAGHAVVAHASPSGPPVRRVSILPRGLALGATQQAAEEDHHLATRAELRDKLAVLMGGHAAEEVILGDVSTGAEEDLKQATELATNMVAHFGMSDELGAVYYEHRAEHPFLGQRIATNGGASDATVHAIEAATRRLIAEARAHAVETIEARRRALDRLVAALLEKETLERDELAASLGASPDERSRIAAVK
ncbi:MAG TPA: ATP-dependent zinc metalloprotease FtsH [Polyangia bacterium]|nr:ATP-dependent zinc metalloprotease FtsH [Polyangia bacterium]